MGLKEKLIVNENAEQKKQSEMLLQQQKEEARRENAKAEELKELDSLALIAENELKPFLEIVNEAKFQNEGSVDVIINAPKYDSCSKKATAGNVEVKLEKSLVDRHGIGFNGESWTDFVLVLQLRQDRKVKVLGWESSDEDEKGASIRLNDRNFQRKIENAILSITNTDKCVDIQERYDSSMDGCRNTPLRGW